MTNYIDRFFPYNKLTMTKLELAIDKIRHIRIGMLEKKMEAYVKLVGRDGETYEDFFRRKYGKKGPDGKDNSSVEMTKQLAALDDKVMEDIGMGDVGKSIGLELEFGDGFDFFLEGVKVEKKNTAALALATAAVGNKFSHNKVDNTWVTRYKPEGNKIAYLNDSLIDLGKAKHPLTGWTTPDGDNGGFNKLVVHNSDEDCIFLFHGSYSTSTKYGKKFIHFTNEKYESK